MNTKIALADDHRLLVQAITKALESQSHLMVVGQAFGTEELTRMLNSCAPDLLLLDPDLPTSHNINLLDVLKEIQDKIKVIILSKDFAQIQLQDLMNHGAKGFLPKNIDFSCLVNAIDDVMNGGYYFSPEIYPLLAAQLKNNQSRDAKTERPAFNERELQLLELICTDKITKEIAEIMKLSERTIDRYKSILYEKTKTKTPAGLVIFAIQNNFFPLPKVAHQ
jgi:DNA-binding NarL/FixJ family response regulator